MLEWPEAGGRARGQIDGPDGPIEVEVNLPEDAPHGVVLVCHPHPQQGGTMDNKVVYMTARAAVQSGFAAVRFNFRGVGESGGDYDEGVGEVDDARAVRDWALAQSGLPLTALAGFSFGSAVVLRLADADGAPPALITIGFPAGYFENGIPRPDSDWLAIFGDEDDVIDVQASIAAVRELDPPATVEIMKGAGHFLHGRLSGLRRLVAAHLEKHAG